MVDFRIIEYETIPNWSLQDLLRKKSTMVLTWLIFHDMFWCFGLAIYFVCMCVSRFFKTFFSLNLQFTSLLAFIFFFFFSFLQLAKDFTQNFLSNRTLIVLVFAVSEQVRPTYTFTIVKVGLKTHKEKKYDFSVQELKME